MIYTLLSAGDPVTKLSVLIGWGLALLFGIGFHEFSHAYTAVRLGDLTPQYQGRVTLNPIAHLDPIGSLMIVLAGFGWGKPVQFNPYRLRMNPRVGTAFVSLAGPTANLILAVVFGLGLRLLMPVLLPAAETSVAAEVALRSYGYFVYANLILAFFNLIPLPPLDGSKILPGILPPDMAYSLERLYAQFGPYSLFILFALFFFAGSIIDPILYGPVGTLFSLIVGPPF